MTTQDKFVNITLKRLMGVSPFKDYFLDYLINSVKALTARVYTLQGTFGSTRITLSSSETDRVKLTGAFYGTDAIGNILLNTCDEDYYFENTSATYYQVALKKCEIPSGVQVNPRTGYPEYINWEEAIGECDYPDEVTDQGTTLRLVVDTITEAGVSNAGREVQVWLITPAQNGTSESVAIETCTVQWDGGETENYIETAALLGQQVGSVDTDASHYKVRLIGPTIKTLESGDLFDVSGYWWVGKVKGSGIGTSPTVFDVTGQRFLPYSLSDWSEAHTSKMELRKSFASTILNWFNNGTDYRVFSKVAGGSVNNGSGIGLVPVYCAVAFQLPGPAPCYIYWSYGGKDWKYDTVAKNLYLTSVCFDPFNFSKDGVFVVVGSREAGGDSFVAKGEGPDFSSWVEQITPTIAILNDVISDGAMLFIAVGKNDGSNAVILCSVDAETWVQKTTGVPNCDLNCVCCGTPNGSRLFVAGGSGGGVPKILTSPDGETWTARTLPASITHAVNDITWNGTVFSLITEGGEVATSADGTTWNDVGAVFDGLIQGFSICSDDTGLMICGGSLNSLWVSIDNGSSWNPLASLASIDSTYLPAFTVYGLGFAQGAWVFGGVVKVDAGNPHGGLFTTLRHGLTGIDLAPIPL